MLLSTSELSYTLSYLPGKKNILADYGTRHIPATDWPISEDDPLELSPFVCSVSSAQVKFPNSSRNAYTTDDFQEMNLNNLQPIDKTSYYTVIINKTERILVPKEL